jgi:hypothetical protein
MDLELSKDQWPSFGIHTSERRKLIDFVPVHCEKDKGSHSMDDLHVWQKLTSW